MSDKAVWRQVRDHGRRVDAVGQLVLAGDEEE